MKRIALLIALSMLLCACTAAAPEEPTIPPSQPTTLPSLETVPPTTQLPETTAPAPFQLSLYTPNDNADGFDITPITLKEQDPQEITSLLMAAKVLNPEISLNRCQVENGILYLDFTEPFLTQLQTYGTAGERMMIGSVVNTFLSAYDASEVYITCNGEIMESGHVVYDFPLGFME